MTAAEVHFNESSTVPTFGHRLGATAWQSRNVGEPFLIRTQPGAELAEVFSLEAWRHLCSSYAALPYLSKLIPQEYPESFPLRLAACSAGEDQTAFIVTTSELPIASFLLTADVETVHVIASANTVRFTVLNPIPSTENAWQRKAISTQIHLSPQHQPASDSSKVDVLDASFEFDGRQSVLSFLEENPALFEVLLEMRQKISEYFGEGTRTKLELLSDPEAVNEQKLFAVILTSLTAEEALRLEERLSNDWWLENLERAQFRLSIDVEYI